MSSTKADEKTESYSATQENINLNDKLTNLSCPFTWGMEKVIETQNKLLDAKNDDRLESVADIQDNFPELVLIYHLLLAYENVVSDDLPGALQSLDSAEKSLVDLKRRVTLKNVENVFEHIFFATKCHVLQKSERLSEVDELLDGICDVEYMNKLELAMLNGCECLAWSLYYATDNLKAIEHAKKAIEYESDNGKWYFLLGKNCRRLRRRHNSIGLKPSPEEVSAFQTAFQLSKNVLFGVSLAQMYRESVNYQMANKYYKEVYDLQPTCCKVRLQLALGFIRAKQCALAKNCLDYVAEHMPPSKIYDHYMAIYHEKCNRDFKAALPYYKSTTENCNAVAEWQYVECRKKVEPDWDPLPYMLGLLTKYEKNTDHVIQGINIQIGAHYLFEKHDVLSACPYLIKAIKISPNARLLKNHNLLFQHFDSVNIYHALTKEVQFALQNRVRKYDDDEIAVLKDALQLCRKNHRDPLPESGPPREQTLGSQLSSNYRNYGRGRSSRAGIRVTGDRPGSSSQGFPRNHPHQSSGDARNSPKERFHKDEKDSTSTDKVKGRSIRQTASSKPRDKNNDSETDAACCLVKTLKSLNI